MTTPPINIPDVLLEALNVIVVVYRDRRKGIRRVYQIAELVPVNKGGIFVKTNMLYNCKPNGDIVSKNPTQRVFEMLNMHTGMTRPEMNSDLKEKTKIVNWIANKNINTVDEVGRLISEYYSNPEFVLRAAANGKDPKTVMRNVD